MICPDCKADNKKSQVHGGITTSTALNCEPYFDEEGRSHYHNLNAVTTKFNCSKGHTFQSIEYGRCWCGWSNDKDLNLK